MSCDNDQNHDMASSAETSPQTPRTSLSPPLREISMSLSLTHSRSSSRASHDSPVSQLRSLGSLLTASTPRSPSRNDRNDLHPSEVNKSTQIPHAPSQRMPSLHRPPPSLPRVNTCPAFIMPSGGSSTTSVNGLGTGFGLEAFKLSSPPTRHPQPNHRTTPSLPERSFWIPSSEPNVQRPQHQRLTSLPSLQIGHRDKIHPTPDSLTYQRGLPASAITPLAHTRQPSDEGREQMLQRSAAHVRHPSAGHPIPIQNHTHHMTHRRHPSSGDAAAFRSVPYSIHLPAWAAPPPPPNLPAHAAPSNITARPQGMGRPRLQIHPYAPPRGDPRYYSAGGLGIHTHINPGLSHVPTYGGERIFMSPSSGISPGDYFKAPRKRADDSQLTILNEVFDRTAYPSTDERDSLARRLGMTSRSVQIWFQNRRRAVKVDSQSAIQRAEAAAETQIMIRGPVPIISKPYPIHPNHRHEREEREEEWRFGSDQHPYRRDLDVQIDPRVATQSNMALSERIQVQSMVKKEILSP
ncbi:uncharacterized protein IL334_006712 [Kwoniella shivajii]|uniref:Homeobox domain-containing protein n=1 Tax=Kwoniella shivajii TaxID=564305 RepID=A0ABZ1D7Y7_9TREE|nr:hypothetical protein IL334_006712 [Kwoniella shivajii]